MAMSLSDYWLIDYFGGKVDLRNKKIRVLHDLSFIDDPTRILRAVRFEQRYNFQIEPKTMEFLKESVKLRMLEKVQPHRTRDDLILVLKEARPIKEIKRLEKLTGFDFIYPGLKITARTYFLLRACEKEINWFRKNYPERRALDSWVIYLISLLDSVSIKIINKISAKFGLRKGEEKRILTYKEAEKRLVCDLSKVKIKPSKLFALLEPLSYETILVLRARHKNFNLKRHIADFLEIYNGMRIFVSGRDLHGLGVLPGPSYLKIFTQVLNAKLNGRVKTKGEELALIKGLIKKRS
ncbi:MAG: hypothetical protein NTW13_05390 [Candidatus Omnitrophica bacterium]|nr:hypothetical protein [Candidatus Omnitrophota bacterium]